MKKRSLSVILIFSLLAFSVFPAYSEDTTPKEYDTDEFPQGLKDLRRFEIVTLGSLPFVSLNTGLVYSTVRYFNHDFDSAYMPSLFSSSYTIEEQKEILFTSIGISIGVGVTDYIIQLIKRGNRKRRTAVAPDQSLLIYPLEEDPDAVPLPPPDSEEESSDASPEQSEGAGTADSESGLSSESAGGARENTGDDVPEVEE